jgi:hypothetical protein
MKHNYLVQRFHPNLQIGSVPFVWHGKRRLPIHCQQGTWDSACGAHCAAIAMAILGHIRDVAVLSEYRNGVAARLWRVARATYFDGVNVTGLASMLEGMGMGRHIALCSGGHSKSLTFILSKLEQGELVIASWRSHNDDHHWILIVGTEGTQVGAKYNPSTLLALDPSVGEPQLTGYNGRLEFSVPLRRNSVCRRYITSYNQELAVRLTSAVSIGSLASSGNELCRQ